MPQSIFNEIITGIHFDTPVILPLHDEEYERKNITVALLRLDAIHPVISGNKLFKLFYFLQEAKYLPIQPIITFGGAFSNHLAATAFACKINNLKSIGVVRGEKPAVLSPTLSFCEKNGMQLEFVSRSSYKTVNAESFLQELHKKFGPHLLIPEGGFSVKGAKGAALITRFFGNVDFTHTCVPVGTATTFAGIIDGSKNECKTIGLAVLKNMNDVDKRLEKLGVNRAKKFSFIGDYHFGGYAKKTGELISFINRFYDQHKVPLDFVYTGKMMFGIHELVKKNYFPAGSKIICIHTGGLQGNNSLPKGVLNF